MASSPPKVIMVPRNFEDCEIDHLVLMISDMLERLLNHNDKIPLLPNALTRFHSRAPPTISVLDYLRRIVKYTHLERACLLIILHYIDQMCARNPRFTVSSLTVHRFLIASITVSTKALCDAFCTNSHYAKIGGIKVAELNLLERELLTALDWRLTSTKELLHDYYVNLARSHSKGLFAVLEGSRATSSPQSHSGSLSSRSNSSSYSRKSSPDPSRIFEVPHPDPASRDSVPAVCVSPSRPDAIGATPPQPPHTEVRSRMPTPSYPSREMETDASTCPDPIMSMSPLSCSGPGTNVFPPGTSRVTPRLSPSSPRVLLELASLRRDGSKRRQSLGSMLESDRIKEEVRRRRVDRAELVR